MWLKYYDTDGNLLGRVSLSQVLTLSPVAEGAGFAINAKLAPGTTVVAVSGSVYETKTDALAAIDAILASEFLN